MANRWVALAIVFVTRTSMGFQFQAVAAVAPLMVADLQLTWVQLGSLIGLYMLPGAVFALPGGVLGQRFGERRMVVGSLALMVAGGLVTAAAHGFITAAAGRLLSGVGAVLMNILLAKMVADWFADREMSTAMGVMLTSWPVGLGIATATLGALATHASWRTAIVATALVAALGDAGFTVSLAIWLTMLSVPLGGLLSDRLGRPNVMIVAGSLVAALVTMLLPAITHSLLAFCLVGLAIGAPPGALMALLPKAVASERLATALGVYYTTYYVVMAAVQLAAGGVRDLFGSPAAPILLAALVMAATIVGFAVFRLVERTTPRTG